MKTTKLSLTIDEAFRNEANKVIAALSNPNYPVDPVIAESVIESLHAISESLELDVAKALRIRLIAIRNHINVNQVVA